MSHIAAVISEKIHIQTVELLKQLIETPSFSTEEDKTADIIFNFLASQAYSPKRFKNNVWAQSPNYDAANPTILLNSHHDTVQPSSAYTRNPFEATVEDGKLYGLGSNDAGGSVVSLLQTFCLLAKEELPYNLVVAITAEEERVCINGISAVWPELPKIDFAIVGEPTQMKAAIAERGLLVLDCVSKGKAGHAARNEGDNALYHAVDDIQWFRTFRFPKVSPLMGEVKMTVTQIQAGSQHNVIPAECSFVVDIRPTDCYKNEEIVELVRQHVKCEVKPRSVHLLASAIDEEHCLVKTAKSLGIECYISPTTSDISRIPVPALKMGPGDSARSHTADEFIYVDEINLGIDGYVGFLKAITHTIASEIK